MTLQNKKTHLLDNDDTQSDVSDAPDLFDQYGGGGADDFSETTSTTQSVTRPHTDDEILDDVTELPSQTPQKKWEQEFGEKDPMQKSQIKTSTKVVKNKSVSELKSKPEQNQAKSIIPPKPKKETSSTITSKKTVSSETSKLQQKEIIEEEILQQQKQTSVVAPVKQNHNSVVQGRPKQIQKESLQSKKDMSLREIHIDPGKKTIMIVDDDIDTMEMYADVFESADYNVIRAADGLEAMSLVAEHTPHVIFTGIVMPRMDGFSMMEALKQNNRTADIPVVINSHLGRDTDKEKAMELGARDFIIRGFTQPREVVERIGALLLKSEYIFHFDKNDKEARKLAKDLGIPNFFRCPRGQNMVLKLSIADEKELIFSARFSCMDMPKEK